VSSSLDCACAGPIEINARMIKENIVFIYKKPYNNT
jgi:hypothetical protein